MTESERQDDDVSTQQQYENWHYTRCPHCEVVFRVDRKKLKVRKGEVRCGACREVFHAPTNRVFRNYGGGFSTLIADPLTQNPSLETVAQGSSLAADEDVLQNDPFSSEFIVPDDPVIESGSLFRETETSGMAADSGNSRLFNEDDMNLASKDEGEGDVSDVNEASSAVDTDRDRFLAASVDDPVSEAVSEPIDQTAQIPKISSEPLLSRPREVDDADGLYREPALSSTKTVDIPHKTPVDPQEAERVPSFDSRSEDVERARRAHLSPLEQEPDHVAASLVLEDKKPTEWSNASVQPFGASAMPMPPSFEPFVPPEKQGADIGIDEADSDGWTSQEDSLLDHNPFARTEVAEEPLVLPVKIRTEPAPRPAAINMSGVDEYIVDRPNPIAGFFWFLVSAAFVVLLGLQVKYFLVERFAQNETYRPYLQVFCGIARCELPPRKDAYRFTITQTRVDLHPREPGALRITVRLLNQAKFAQPYPDLRLTLTDRVGRVVGRRKFDPDSYLAKASATRLAPGELGYVIFDLAQPHEKAVGFVVDVVRRSS